MPYNKVNELPPGVKNALPKEAQSVFMKAYNAAHSAAKKKGMSDKNIEKYANSIGWVAVKKAGFSKDKSGKWSKKGKASTELDRALLKEILPAGTEMTVNDPELVPDVESLLLAPKEVCEAFLKAYETAMSSCKNAKGYNCEEEAFIMGLVKVRAAWDENPKGSWVPKITRPPKASLE
jgi:cation transport regulator